MEQFLVVVTVLIFWPVFTLALPSNIFIDQTPLVVPIMNDIQLPITPYKVVANRNGTFFFVADFAGISCWDREIGQWTRYVDPGLLVVHDIVLAGQNETVLHC